jgi:nucleoside-diphosphate-sugar epimerase
MNKILVIGGAGYIGGAVSEILDVTVLDNLMFEDRFLKPIPFQYADVRDLNTLDKIVHDYDTLIVLAGLVGDLACSIDPLLTYDINVKHVNWLAKNYEGKIIFTSSCSVYGANNDILNETSPVNPLSLYAKTKLEAEEILLINKPDTLIYRLGTVFGLGDLYSRPRLDLVVNILTARAAQGKVLKVFGEDQWRPLIHVRDVADGIAFGIQNKLVGVYNLSYSNQKIKDIALSIANHLPTKIEYSSIPYEDLRNYKVTGSKMAGTGWSPKLTLDTGILEIYDLIKSNRIKKLDNELYHNGNFIRKYYG